MADDFDKRHSRRQTVAGTVITLSIVLGVFVGYRLYASHGLLIATAVGLFIPCATLIIAGMTLVFLGQRRGGSKIDDSR